ncbi:hypothetical protein TRFO_07655 [Tritrichomonas foetus]|uniref:Uncharacterized protein n=1 Tax=Tritrichomonas foetus TaxID=1144522 RepID=A0A1J4JPB8_9EUKA|nr:hypothetical protein TRFO_07655 [Tritrichomonas foetus]|eukprot:OHT00999.1 hypothetical protein TRFO_07655 [Tritrichomonas foetus]
MKNVITFHQLIPSIVIPPAITYKFLQYAKRTEENQFIVIAKISFFFFSKMVQFRCHKIISYQKYIGTRDENKEKCQSDEIPIFISFLSPENYDDASIEDEKHIKKNFLQEIRYQNEATFKINNMYQLCILVTYSNNNLKLTFDILFPKAIVEIEKIDRPSLSESHIINAVNHGIEGMDDPRIFSLALSIYLLTMKPFPLRFNRDFFQVSVKDEMKVDILSHSISILDDQICESAQVIQFLSHDEKFSNNTSIIESINDIKAEIQKRDLISIELFGSILCEVKKIKGKEKKEKIKHQYNLRISPSIIVEIRSVNQDFFSEQDQKLSLRKSSLKQDNINMEHNSSENQQSINKSDYYLEIPQKTSQTNFQNNVKDNDLNQQQNQQTCSNSRLLNYCGDSKEYQLPDSMQTKSSVSKQFFQKENQNMEHNFQNIKERDDSLTLGTDEMSVDSKLFMKMISKPI